MEKSGIKLLQFLICRDFTARQGDTYAGDAVFSNLYVPSLPYQFEKFYAVTCWRKDKMFHKEVIEYETEDGSKVRTPHMDIEPITDSILFRWHKHRFPSKLKIHKNGYLSIRVILDWEIVWESQILVEKRG